MRGRGGGEKVQANAQMTVLFRRTFFFTTAFKDGTKPDMLGNLL